jgi:hypothetical protein
MLSAAAPPRRGLSTRRLLAACPCQHQGAACPPSPLDLECLLQTDEPNRNLAIGRLARSEDDRLSGDRSVDTARSRGRSLRSGAVQAVSAKGKRDKQDARPTTIIFSPPSRVFLQPSSHRDWRVRSGNRDRHGTLSEGTVVRAWPDNLAEVFLRPSHDHREFGEQSAAFRGPFAPDDFEACAMTTTPRREVSAAKDDVFGPVGRCIHCGGDGGGVPTRHQSARSTTTAASPNAAIGGCEPSCTRPPMSC